MPIQVVCRACQTAYEFPDEVLGRTVRCKTCQGLFVAEAAPADGLAVQAAATRPVRPGVSAAPTHGTTGDMRRPKSALPLILGIVGGVALLMLLVCGGLVGLGFYRYKVVRDEIMADEMMMARRATAVARPFVGESQFIDGEQVDSINRIHVQFNERHRFGIVCPRLRDSRAPENPKKLTANENGATNNTVVRIDGFDSVFGAERPSVKEVPPGKDKDRAWQVWEQEPEKVRITQCVEIVVGEQTRLYDTALVRYQLWNRGTTPRTVGLRVMLDTYVGGSDGAPFFAAPSSNAPAQVVDKLGTWTRPNVPGFLQALESGNLQDANAVLAVVGLKVRDAEPPEKVVLCRWPGNPEARWDWQHEQMDRDSCVVIYWAQTIMRPGERRDLAYTCGLGRMPGDPATKTPANGVRLFVGPGAVAGKPFVVGAYVKGGDRVSLSLPGELKLVDGDLDMVPVPTADGNGVVCWRVQADKAGKYDLEVKGPAGSARAAVEVLAGSLFE